MANRENLDDYRDRNFAKVSSFQLARSTTSLMHPNEANFDETISIAQAQEFIQVTANSGALSGLDKGVAESGEGSTPREVAGAAADGRLCSVPNKERRKAGNHGTAREGSSWFPAFLIVRGVAIA